MGLFGRINGSVVNAGFFQGTGIVNGNVFNSGIFSSGASIGTLTISGDYTQNASGALRIEVAGASPGQYDVLAVNGRANIAGMLQLVRVGNFRLQVGDRIGFLTVNSGVIGTFDNVENDFLATDSVVVLDIVYLQNSAVLAGTQVVVLEGAQGSFAEFTSFFCGTPNAIAVGEALDSALGDPRASELIDFLNKQALTDLCEDIDLISPEQLTSLFVVGTSLANIQTANLERRMTDIRAGSSGFSSSGFAINGSGSSFWEGFAGVSGPAGKSGAAVFAPVPQNRWGVFATGLGEFTNVDSTFNASGYDLATGGFTVGIDYRIGSNFAIGLTGGYAYTGADLVNDSRIQANGQRIPSLFIELPFGGIGSFQVVPANKEFLRFMKLERAPDWNAVTKNRLAAAHFNVFFAGKIEAVDQSPFDGDPVAMTDTPGKPNFANRDCIMQDDLKGQEFGLALAHEAGHALGEGDNNEADHLMNVKAPGRKIPPTAARRMNDHASTL